MARLVGAAQVAWGWCGLPLGQGRSSANHGLHGTAGSGWRWLHGRKQAVAASDQALWNIWGRQQAATPPNQDWLAHLAELPPFPDYATLTHSQLRHVLETYNAGKAAGPDGWRIAELKLWRKPMLRWVADLLEVVEATGKWPAELLRGGPPILSTGGPSR